MTATNMCSNFVGFRYSPPSPFTFYRLGEREFPRYNLSFIELMGIIG